MKINNFLIISSLEYIFFNILSNSSIKIYVD